MINTLLLSDIEILRADEAFKVGDVSYGAGSFVIPLAQPKMGLIRNLLSRTLYPDNEWTRGRDGAPLRPYDSATHTMAEFMGVRVDPVSAAVEAELVELTGQLPLGRHGGTRRIRPPPRRQTQRQLQGGQPAHGGGHRGPPGGRGVPRVPAGRFCGSRRIDWQMLERVAAATGVDFRRCRPTRRPTTRSSRCGPPCTSATGAATWTRAGPV